MEKLAKVLEGMFLDTMPKLSPGKFEISLPDGGYIVMHVIPPSPRGRWGKLKHMKGRPLRHLAHDERRIAREIRHEQEYNKSLTAYYQRDLAAQRHDPWQSVDPRVERIKAAHNVRVIEADAIAIIGVRGYVLT